MCVWKQLEARGTNAPQTVLLTSGLTFNSSTGRFPLQFATTNLSVAAGDHLIVRFVEFLADVSTSSSSSGGSSRSSVCDSISRDDTVWAEKAFQYCPGIAVSIDCPSSNATRSAAAHASPQLVWQLPQSMRQSGDLIVCVFHRSPGADRRFVTAVHQPLSSHLTGVDTLLSGAFGASLVVRLEQPFLRGLGDSSRQCEVPRALGGSWPLGTLVQTAVQTCSSPMRVRFSLQRVPSDSENPFRLLWHLNPTARSSCLLYTSPSPRDRG